MTILGFRDTFITGQQKYCITLLRFQKFQETDKNTFYLAKKPQLTHILAARAEAVGLRRHRNLIDSSRFDLT